MQKNYAKFLLIFSLCILSACGFLWACGYSEDDEGSSFSAFNPEYFTGKTNSIFFYTDDPQFGKDTTGIYNDNFANNPITDEWDKFIGHALPKQDTHYLLFKADLNEVDSVYRYLSGEIGVVPPSYPLSVKVNVAGKKVNSFFQYLRLAKQCEKFAAPPREEYYGWGSKPDTIVIPKGLDVKLENAFTTSKDPFIKERLWFQCVRLAYFEDKSVNRADSLSTGQLQKSRIVQLFHSYEKDFAKNLIYYRTLGYLAGYYYRHKAFAKSNYLYSLCYANTNDLRWSSNWSFHPQEESDWAETLHMAKNTEEQIMLWQLLGINNDDNYRAIREIAKLDPHSNKLDVFLGRLINNAEYSRAAPSIPDTAIHFSQNFAFDNSAADIKFVDALNDSAYNVAYQTAFHNAVVENVKYNQNIRLVDSMSNIKSIAKHYYWHLAAGYLHFLADDFAGCARFYALAEKEFPGNDQMIMAQFKVLSIMLYAHQVDHIDPKTEAKLTEPLNWLANLKDGKDTIKDLRFQSAITETMDALSKVYLKQGDKIKAALLGYDNGFYNSYGRVDSLITFINKPQKTPFEQALVRYSPNKLEALYYQQALIMTYRQDFDRAVVFMNMTDTVTKNAELYGNPFNSRLNDCHDCDHAALQKRKYSRLNFLKTLKTINNDLKAGKNVYRNAYLMANAYYNINEYGNARFFYQDNLFLFFTLITSGIGEGLKYANLFTRQDIAEKYYIQAFDNAGNNEQRALCAFMLSKCERNTYYNVEYDKPGETTVFSGLDNDSSLIPDWSHFKVLNTRFSGTKYYAEVLKECGDFKSYVDSIKQTSKPHLKK